MPCLYIGYDTLYLYVNRKFMKYIFRIYKTGKSLYKINIHHMKRIYFFIIINLILFNTDILQQYNSMLKKRIFHIVDRNGISF